MKNLEDLELKNEIAKNIYKALENSKNPAITIKFIFKIQDDPKWKDTYKIEYFAGNIKFKNVDFNYVKKDTAIAIIVSNFYLNHFSFLDEEYINGKIECHGHGEYWGEDTWIFRYIRYNE